MEDKTLAEDFATLALAENPEALIRLVKQIQFTSIERSEARYFQHAAAPRYSACKSALKNLRDILQRLKRPKMQGFLSQEPTTTQAAQRWSAPCIFNGSGSGKTFFNHFLLDHLRDYISKHPTEYPEVAEFLASHRVLRVWIPQFNGQQVNSDETDIRLYISAAIASQLLLEEQNEQRLNGVTINSLLNAIRRTRLEKLFLEPAILLQAIRIVQKIRDDEAFLILSGHDEMQTLTTPQQFSQPNNETRQNSLVYKYITSAMEFTVNAAAYNVAVFNLFTGTSALHSTTLLAQTRYQWSPIQFDPLTLADGVALLKSKHPSLSTTFDSPNIAALLELIGNIPRVWELFSKELDNDPSPFTSSSSVINMCDVFAEKVERWTIPMEQLHAALLVMVQRWTLEDIIALEKPEILNVVMELTYDGRLFTRERNEFFIPLIFLRNSVKSLHKENVYRKIFVTYADLCWCGTFDDQTFEQFCLSFLVLKYNLFVETKFEVIDIAEFFKGAWMANDVTGNFEIGEKTINIIHHTAADLTSFHHVETKGVIPKTFEDIRKHVPIAFWVGKTVLHQDALLLLPNNISIHLKFSTIAHGTSVGNSNSACTREQQMAESSPVALKNNFFVYLTNQFVSDRPDKKENKHAKSFVVCRNNFSEFFSGIFSFLVAQIR